MGLTEMETDDTDKPLIPGFVTFMKNRKKFTKTRSCGIMLVVKNDIVKYVKTINTDCKYVFWFKLSIFILNIKDDVLCGVICIPPKGIKYSSLDCFSDIEQELLSFTKDKENVCLMILILVGHLLDLYTPDNYLMHVNNCEDIFLLDIASRSLIFEKCNVALKKTTTD